MARARALLRYRAIQWLAGRMLAGYILLVRATGRWTIENADAITRRVADGDPFIACFWHGRVLMVPHAWVYSAPLHVVISQHRDGRLLAGAMSGLGIGIISGSSSRGGIAAIRGIVKLLKQGEFVGLTPDGPRGPRMRASLGVVRAAQRTGVPIVPVSFAASRRRVLGSWDRFVLALPFARGVIRIGDFIDVPTDADADTLERYRLRLENELNLLTRELDARFGFEAIEAAPPLDSVESRR